MSSSLPDGAPASGAAPGHVTASPATADLLFDAARGAVASGARVLSLDGSSQHLARSHGGISYPFSVACWFRKAPGPNGVIWSAGADGMNWNAHYVDVSDSHVTMATAVAATTFVGRAHGAIEPGRTYHLAAVYESATSGRLYLDGVEQEAGDPAAAAPAGVNHEVVGGVKSAAGVVGNHFGGLVAGLGRWSRALSAAEAAALYDGGAWLGRAAYPAGLAAGLVRYWRLGEPSGDRADSESGAALAPAGDPRGIVSPLIGPPGEESERAWHRRPANVIGAWALPPGTPPATYGHFGPFLEHAPDRPGFRRAGATFFPGTSWEFGLRAHTPVRPGMAEVELCRSEGADGAIARVVIDSEGRPSYRAAGPGGSGEVHATCPTPLYGRLAVTGGAVRGIGVRALPGGAPFGPERSTCRLHVADLGNVAVGDLVTVRGCGAPFDGERRIQLAHDDPAGGPPYVEFCIEGDGHAGATPSAGEVIPTGEYEHSIELNEAWAEMPPRQIRPAPLRVRRGGDALEFWESGRPLGSATAAGLPAGPGPGSTATIGSGDPATTAGPAMLPTLAEGFAAPLGGADAFALDARLCARVSGLVDHAGMACHVDLESFPGVPRRQSHLHDFAIIFTDDRDRLLDGPIDEHTGDRRGVGHGDYSACDLGHEDQATQTRYRVWVAAFGKRWSESGEPLPPSLIGMAPIAEPRRLPWGRPIHVDADAGDDAAGDGSASRPWRTFGRARGELRPGTILRLRGAGLGDLSLVGISGPVMLTTWGSGRTVVDQGASWSCFAIAQASHVAIKRFELRHSSTAPRDGTQGWMSFNWYHAVGITIRDVVARKHPAGGAVQMAEFWGAAYTAIHDYLGDGDTTPYRYCVYFTQGARRVSLRRVRFLHGPGDAAHALRTIGTDCFEASGMRYPPEMTGHWGAGFTLRHNPRRASVALSDLGNRSLYFSNNNDQPYGSAVADPPGNRCVSAHVSCRNVALEGTAGGRITACFGEMNPMAAGFSFDPSHRPYPAVVEGSHSPNQYGGIDVAPGAPVLAIPYAGPRRNTSHKATADTGEPLWSPSAVALQGPPGWAVAAADGLPQGGVGGKRSTWVVDGEPVPGASAAVLVRPLPAGEHEYRLGVVDAAGAEALGPRGMTFVAPGDGPPAGYALVPPPRGSGLVGEPSDPFTVAIPEAADPDGPVEVTPSSDGPGRFEPPSVVLTAEGRSATFRFIPEGGVGSRAISTGNDAGLIDPAAVTFTATIAAGPPEGVRPIAPVPPFVPPIAPGAPITPPGAEIRTLAPRPRGDGGDRRPGAAPGSLAAPPRRRGS